MILQFRYLTGWLGLVICNPACKCCYPAQVAPDSPERKKKTQQHYGFNTHESTSGVQIHIHIKDNFNMKSYLQVLGSTEIINRRSAPKSSVASQRCRWTSDKQQQQSNYDNGEARKTLVITEAQKGPSVSFPLFSAGFWHLEPIMNVPNQTTVCVSC